MAIKAWGFEGSGTTPPTPQTPYGDKAVTIPAKIEAENYDVPGTGRGGDVDSYSDNDSENQGDADFRSDLGVDIVLGGTGKAIGYTAAGEWLEYSIVVPEDGSYAIKASASTGMENGASFCLLVDGKAVGDTVKVPQTGEDWSVYEEFDAGSATLTKGEHIVRLVVTGDNVNVDWFSIGETTTGIHQNAKLNVASVSTYDVFDLSGKKIASFKARNMIEASKMWRDGSVKGSEKARGVNLIRNRTSGMVTKIRTTK